MNTKKQAVVLFNFGKQPIRTTVINGEPWFVAKDVCDILELENSRDILAKMLDDDEKGVEKIYTLGGYQDMNIINESGLYNLIFRSNKPEAKAFRKWVTSEVLPSIRMKGYYGADMERYSERKLDRLLSLYAKKAINVAQFEFLIGMPPSDFMIEDEPHPRTKTTAFVAAVARDVLRDFIEKNMIFEDGVDTVIQDAYDAYMDYNNFDEADVERGEAAGRYKFTRWILDDFYNRGVRVKNVRKGNKIMRCFLGLRLRPLEELEESI